MTDHQGTWNHKVQRYQREAEKRHVSDDRDRPPIVYRPSHVLYDSMSNMATIRSQQQLSSNNFESKQYYPAGSSSEAASVPQSNLSVRTAFDKDPYQHIDHLGSGAYGYVDTVMKVDQPFAVFARKTIRVTSGRNREAQLKSVEQEFRILNRLKHDHVMAVLEIYSYRNKLSIIMLDVADMDMKEYLEKLDELPDGAQREPMQYILINWPGCLIQAIDYLHEMKVKHKDLKPANILVKHGKLLITDFGIAKDLIDEETTASLISEGAQGSPMYMAPEINLGQRRGRAVDIFSLGCIFLEISTGVLLRAGHRERFSEFRNVNGSRAYSKCPDKLLQWIWFLWGSFNQSSSINSPYFSPFSSFSAVCAELAFIMLDPNPKTRPTSRQLVQMIHCEDSIYLKDIKTLACDKCCRGPMWRNPNLPLHSTFKPDSQYSFPARPLDALTENFNGGWEGAKRLWLATHMWW